MNLKYDLARYSTKDTIQMLTCLLEKVIQANDTSANRKVNCFQARSVPSISIHAYMTRILKYCPCQNECFLALLVYFDRMSTTTTVTMRIDSYNIHRLIIAGLMVSSKLFSDVFFTNTRYAKVGGLPVAELNKLELEFLSMNNFALFISLDELQHYGDQLLSHWNKEHPFQLPLNEKQDELDAPVIRRARHLSIDKHGDEIMEIVQNNKKTL